MAGIIEKLIQLAAGKTPDELAAAGPLAYPEMDEQARAENRPAHRLAAKLTTERHGPAIAQGLGVGNELLEAATRASAGVSPAFRPDTGRDLAANLQGSLDAYQPLAEALLDAFSRGRERLR